MKAKVTLTDKFLAALQPAPSGTRPVHWDAVQPNFGVRVTDKGARTFYAVRRQAGTGKLVWTPLGAYPAMTLKTARRLARVAIDALEAGQNPTQVKAAKAREEARRAADTVAGAIEEFLTDREVAKLRTARSLTACLRRDFLGQRLEKSVGDKGKPIEAWVNGREPLWRDRSITSIGRRDVIERIEAINRRRGKYACHHAYAVSHRFFAWAVERDVYGIEVSPCSNINIKRLVGAKERRDRVLSDAEIRLVWRAAGELPKPYGQLIQALMVTGQRLSEIAEARWTELDLDARLLSVPSARMKMKAPHAIPLTNSVLDLLKELPRFKGGEFAFTTTGGARPVSGFSKWKERLDEKVMAAGAQLEPPLTVAPFVLHDLRRTVRTRLSALGVPRTVAELVIGHAQQGIEAVYDVHTYDAEKRDALERWEQALLAIIENRPPEVSDLAQERARRISSRGHR